MNQIKATYKKTGRLHHAYVILGNRSIAKEALLSFLEKDLKFPIKGNPDLWQKEFFTLKIADSRFLKESHQSKPVKYDKKIFIIFTNFITKDAQNSLLKIFEEPQAGSIFFLVMPSGSDLISTLKSRLIFGNIKDNKVDSALSAETFLSSKIGERLGMVSKITKDIKDEKINKLDAISFIKSIEKIIKENNRSKKAKGSRDESLLAIEDIEKAISYASDESPSMKVILEHLAVVL